MSDSAAPTTGRHSRRSVRRVALVVNPKAGHGLALRLSDRAARRLRERGVEPLVLAGETAEETRALVLRSRNDPSIDAVVLCGGDGLVHLAVQELASSDTPLGLIPAGTGNDLAREYGIPRGTPEAAADVVVAGRVEHADLGAVTTDDGRRTVFASVVAAGLDSVINRRVNEMGFPSGASRYAVASILEYPRYRPRSFRLEFDDGEVLEREVLLSAYAVTRSYGGGMHIAPEADRGDGLLDVCVMERMSVPRALLHFPKLYAGTHAGVRGVTMRRCRKVRVEATDVEAYADGDLVAPLPVTVECLPSAGLVLVP